MRTEIKQQAEDYEPFGHEWEKALMKLPKAFIIELYRKQCQSKDSEVITDLIKIAESFLMCFPQKPSRQKKHVQDTIDKAKCLTKP
jgi:hypothetical protein